jgi:diguanylate cyclase (GGDEF)-like protein
MSAQELYEKRMREIRSQDVRVGRLVRRDGRIIEAISRITPEGGWVSTNEDITDRCNAEAQIWHLARHDALTKLPNRILFRERMTEALERVLNQSETVSLFVIDLDNFKAINDRLGHTGGDELLAIVAKRIARCLRSVDTAARLGGDEFVVLLRTGSADAAAKLACRIIDRASQPIVLNNQEIEPGLSIGIALAPLDGISEVALMKCADIALYRCKDAGRRTFRFFDETTDQCMRAKYVPRETTRRRAETSELEAKARRPRRSRREIAAA